MRCRLDKPNLNMRAGLGWVEFGSHHGLIESYLELLPVSLWRSFAACAFGFLRGWSMWSIIRLQV